MKPLTQSEKYELYYQASKEVLVDFDGTLCEFAYPEFGPPRRGAKAFMEWLVARGLKPVVWSSRFCPKYISSPNERLAIGLAIDDWLTKHDIPCHEIDVGHNGKRLALAYVDDRGVAAGEGTTWADARKRINEIHRREVARWKEIQDEEL